MKAKCSSVLSALPDLDKQYAAEGQLLVNALQATDQQVAREAAVEFLKLRQTRRAAEDKAVAAYEQMTEWVEGLARYAEVALMLRANRALGQHRHLSGSR